MRKSWRFLLPLSGALIVSGVWVSLMSADLIRTPFVRTTCSTIQKPRVGWATTDKSCVEFFEWQSWETVWEHRLDVLGKSTTVLGGLGLLGLSMFGMSKLLRRGPTGEALSHLPSDTLSQ